MYKGVCVCVGGCGLTWDDVDVTVLIFVDVDFSSIRRESDVWL